jgi:DNA-binding MarR family transcriptional regulator
MQEKPPALMNIGGLLTDVRASLVEEIQRRVAEAGFTDVRASHDCVFRFLQRDGTRLSDLANRSEMTPQTIGEHVDELERLGYVERAPDPSDRRAKLIRPTARGIAFMDAGMAALSEIERDWTAALGARPLSQLQKTLAEIRALQGRGARSQP